VNPNRSATTAAHNVNTGARLIVPLSSSSDQKTPASQPDSAAYQPRQRYTPMVTYQYGDSGVVAVDFPGEVESDKGSRCHEALFIPRLLIVFQ
jgi:hypothetical protein